MDSLAFPTFFQSDIHQLFAAPALIRVASVRHIRSTSEDAQNQRCISPVSAMIGCIREEQQCYSTSLMLHIDTRWEWAKAKDSNECSQMNVTH